MRELKLCLMAVSEMDRRITLKGKQKRVQCVIYGPWERCQSAAVLPSGKPQLRHEDGECLSGNSTNVPMGLGMAWKQPSTLGNIACFLLIHSAQTYLMVGLAHSSACADSRNIVPGTPIIYECRACVPRTLSPN